MPSTARIGAASRRQRVPPALTRGPDRLDGISILDELKGDLGLVLWRSARNVRLWAETPLDRRGELFADGAALTRREELDRLELDAELLAPMSVIVALLEAPGRAEVQRLVNACRRIALWAEHRGALGTALEFSQAAALVAPDAALLAYAVGRLARRRSDYDRAESWYARAGIQGRQAGNWRAYALACSGMANLHMQRGNYPAARRGHQRCLRVTLRHGVSELLGIVYHDLFVVTAAMGDGFAADPLAANAFRAYGPREPRVIRLAYDVAYHWTLHGFFPGALSVATALLPHIHESAMRALIQGLAARSAGGAGRRDDFESAAAGAMAVIEQGFALEMTASTLLHLAYGAMSLGEWERASEWADRSLQIARERREGRIVLEAEAAYDAASRRVGRPTPALTPAAEPVTELAEQFVEVLSGKLVGVGA